MSGPSVGDPATMRSRLLSDPCQTCIVAYADRNPMHLSRGRLRQIVREARESFIVCHATLPGMAPPGVRPAICRGFYDKFGARSQAIQIISRLFGFTEVPPPDQPGGPPCSPP